MTGAVSGVLCLAPMADQRRDPMKAATIILATVFAATPALADPGHFAQLGGHSHWLTAGCLAAAALVIVLVFMPARTPFLVDVRPPDVSRKPIAEPEHGYSHNCHTTLPKRRWL